MDEKANKHLFDRRSYLKMAGTTAMAAAIPLTSATKAAAQSESHSEEIGGGDSYVNVVSRSEADDTAASPEELHDALSRASSGDVIYVTGGFDASNETFAVPAGVTLSGDRGVDGADGPLISTDTHHESVIDAAANSRITGLRFEGPLGTSEYEEPVDAYPAGAGIETDGAGVKVDNCEIFGFAYAGVHADGNDCHVHHNRIYHCSRDGLGYGVVVNNGAEPVIEYNYFNYNRHSVACDGDPTSGYTVRYNVFGLDIISFSIDVHRPGGGTFEVHHNTIMGTERIDGSRPYFGVVIRGVPEDVYSIHHNWFYHTVSGIDPDKSTLYHSGQAIMQYQPEREDYKNVEFWKNHFGPDEPAPTIGAPRTDRDTDGGRPNTVTIVGDGSRTDYSITVSGSLEGESLTGEDNISDSTATGAVGPGQDSYHFSGEITDFTMSGDAMAFLNGEKINPTRSLPHTLTIVGDGSRTDYHFSVSGALEGESLTREDDISGSTATGAVAPGRDSYRFSGEITDLSVNGDATVFLDGEKINPADYLPHVLVIEGEDSRTDYSITVSGSLEGESLTGEDSISGSTATGAVGPGRDSYHFSGEITDFDLNGPATIALNGTTVDPKTLG